MTPCLRVNSVQLCLRAPSAYAVLHTPLASQHMCYYHTRKYEHLMRQCTIVVEEHTDNYIAYPWGLKGVVVGKDDTCEEALKNAKSVIRFHIGTFGK